MEIKTRRKWGRSDVQIKPYLGAKEFRNCVKIDPKGLLSNPAIEKISASERLVLAIPK